MDVNRSQFSVIHQFVCGHCGNAERQTWSVPTDAINGRTQVPLPSLPRGWRLVEGTLYCYKHLVRTYVRVSTPTEPEPAREAIAA